MNTQFTNTFKRDADAGQTGSLLSAERITEATNYWKQFRKLPIGNAEMIMHLATFAATATPPIEREAMEVKTDVIIYLKKLRAYFGEHDKTITEHTMYAIADKAIKTLSGAVEGNGWIDVCDKLPEPDIDILGYSLEDLISICYMNETEFFFGIGGNSLAITHWQPLPNIPKNNQ